MLVVLWSWRSYVRIDDPQARLAELTELIPSWLSGTFGVLYAFAALYAVGLFVSVLFQWRDRFDAVRDMVLSVVMTGVIVVLLVSIISGEWPRVLPETGLAEPVSQFPILRVAIVTAGLRAIDPHLTRPLRRFGWAVILLTAVAGVALGFGLASSAIGAIALGISASSAVLLIFGSPRGYPDLESIRAALDGLGVPVTSLELDDNQSWGVRSLIGESNEHGRVEVKAYGRDATDSQLAARFWRYLWYRDTEPSLSLTRMQAVEHEALVTMMAARSCDAVPTVLAAGLGGDEVAILAVDRSGVRLSNLGGELSDDLLVEVWRSVGDLRAAAISHGGLGLEAITVSDGGHQIGDFSSGTLGASEAFLALDVVELMFSLSQVIGVDRAVESARVGLGEEALAEVLPYVQVPAVRVKTRRGAEKPKIWVGQLREKLHEVTGVEAEEVVQIRRVQVRSLVMTGLSLFAAYFLIGMLGDIDWAEVWETVRDAEWGWILAAFIIGQLVFFPDATGMLAAVGYPIPLRPTVILQSAIKFISLAVPSSAGRIGMTAAFLRKYGVSFTASLVQGSIDTISGLIVETVIIFMAVVFGDLDLGFSSGDPEWGIILLILAVVAIVAITAVRRIERLRDWIMPVIGEAWGALGGVIKDPKRTLALLGSNFASRFIFAISMWLILQSMGTSLNIFSVLAATVLTGLLGGVIPVPGGIGVSEAILTASLVIFGVDETTAFAAAVVYRVVTFYIPSGYGWFSMQWLDKNGYI